MAVYVRTVVLCANAVLIACALYGLYRMVYIKSLAGAAALLLVIADAVLLVYTVFRPMRSLRIAALLLAGVFIFAQIFVSYNKNVTLVTPRGELTYSGQRDVRWAFEKFKADSTVGNKGCGLAVAAMLGSLYGGASDPVAAREELYLLRPEYENSYGEGMDIADLASYAESVLGRKTRFIDADNAAEEMTAEMMDGAVFVILHKKHFVMTAYADGGYRIIDPANANRMLFADAERFIKKTSQTGDFKAFAVQ